MSLDLFLKETPCGSILVNDVEVSQAFHDFALFKRFIDLNPNLFNYLFNVIQNWQTDALQFYLMVLIFC